MIETIIRDVEARDYDMILELNEELVHFLSPMDISQLEEFRRVAQLFKVVELDGEAIAFMIVLKEGLDYESENYCYFAKNYDSFLYVDRVVVSPKHHAHGCGKLMYDTLFEYARATNEKNVLAEINIEPVNVPSLKFHERYGFKEVHTQWLCGGKKRVSLQASLAF